MRRSAEDPCLDERGEDIAGLICVGADGFVWKEGGEGRISGMNMQ